MEKILQQIEANFAPQITAAQEALNIAQIEYNNIVAIAEDKKRVAREYYEALAQKEQAEIIIANAPQEIKSLKP